jgi:N-acetylglucosaminyldiphosphoundecaprenol N-acetyl-beta-D-mannosaminyltransferase
VNAMPTANRTPRHPQYEHYDILGVRIDAVTIAQSIKLITARALEQQKTASYVVKPYVEFLDRVQNDSEIRQLLSNAWLSLPDGVSTQWAATYLYGGRRSWWRLFGLLASIIVWPRAIRQPLPEKFGGTVFTTQLLAACAQQGLTVYLVGSPSTTAIAATARQIQRLWPDITIAGTWPGRMAGRSGIELRRALKTQALEQALVDDLTVKRPDIILVGMGFPLQEELMAKVAPQLKHGVLIGEGGTFDYDSFGGKRSKAPVLLQRVGLEWLWRLLLEPKRWRRQLAIPRFIWSVYQAGRSRPS